MFIRLILFLILAASAELAVLVWLTSEAGFATTLLVILVTGLLGAVLTRWQGVRAWNAIRADLAAGRMPAASVVDGVVFLMAAALLLTPGLISDTCGFLLLLPPVRKAFRIRLIAWWKRRIEGRIRTYASRGTAAANGEIIDVEFRRADAAHIESHPDSAHDR